GEDEIYGGDGNDNLFGQGDDDTINGDNGNDLLEGGSGSDYLAGGNDNDTYAYQWNLGDPSLGSDTIHETRGVGTGTDTVDFTNFNAPYSAPNRNLTPVAPQTVSSGILTITFDPASNVETTVAPVSSGPRISQLVLTPTIGSGLNPAGLTLTAI